jgi:hypothetical protein
MAFKEWLLLLDSGRLDGLDGFSSSKKKEILGGCPAL